MANIPEKIKEWEETISLIGGIVVVLVIGFLAWRLWLGKKPQSVSSPAEQQEQVRSEEGEITSGEEKAKLPTAYVVQKGDHLWKIAEKFYGSGYNWVDIAQANKLANPGIIYQGQKLVIMW